MESCIENLTTSEMFRFFISAHEESVPVCLAKTATGFIEKYKDKYGFELENKSGARVVFRPDLAEGYFFKDGNKYSFSSKEFSRYRNKISVNNENFDGGINGTVIRILEETKLYEKLLKLNLITMRNNGLYYGDSDRIIKFFSMDEDFLIWLFENTSIRTNQRFNPTFQLFLPYLYEKFGRSIAEYFCLSYNKASVRLCGRFYSYEVKEKLTDLCSRIHDPRRTIDYLLFETYTQGIRDMGLDRYIEYLKAIDEHPELGFSRYPENFATVYYKAVVALNTIKNRKFDAKAYEYDKYVIEVSSKCNTPSNVPVFSCSFCLIDKVTKKTVAVFGLGWMKIIDSDEFDPEREKIIKEFRKDYFAYRR